MKEATPEGLPALLNPSSFRGHVTSDSSKQIPKEVVEGCNPANFPHSLLVSDIHISDQFFLVCKYEVQQNTTFLITCVKKLSSIHFRNLDYLCPVVLPFQQIPGLKSSTWPGPVYMSCLKKAATVICWDYDIHPKRQCSLRKHTKKDCSRQMQSLTLYLHFFYLWNFYSSFLSSFYLLS